jgi:hypothetical protein
MDYKVQSGRIETFFQGRLRPKFAPASECIPPPPPLIKHRTL